jgi:peptidoglycan/LPS O-acetylase OafA/YrhL
MLDKLTSVQSVQAAQSERKPVPQPETRLLDLDGIRGIAILMVLLCHYVFLPDIGRAAPGSLQVFCFHLFASGVELFFVLSGFLIGGILLDHRTSPTYFRGFYGRRIFRIIPVYYGFLLLTAVAGVILHARGSPTPVFDAANPYWTFFLFLQNFSLAWYGDWHWLTVSMAWSLALEEQFYLTLPVAVKGLKTKTLVLMSSLLVFGAPVVRVLFSTTPHTLGVLVNEAVLGEGLAAGFLCAALVRSGLKVSSRWLRVATLFLAPFVAVTHIAPSPIAFLRETSLIAIYSCILLLATRGSIAIFRSSILRFFGTISYTLYLVHQSALVLLHLIVRHAPPSDVGGKAILASIAAFLLCIAGCWYSWLYVEKPLISWARGKYPY